MLSQLEEECIWASRMTGFRNSYAINSTVIFAPLFFGILTHRLEVFVVSLLLGPLILLHRLWELPKAQQFHFCNIFIQTTLGSHARTMGCGDIIVGCPVMQIAQSRKTKNRDRQRAAPRRLKYDTRKIKQHCVCGGLLARSNLYCHAV